MTLTMRRNYGLVLPKNYVSIEKDEMEYIDGGMSWWQKGLIIGGIVVVGAAVTTALIYGQFALAAKIMGLTFKKFVQKLGAKAVATVITTTLGVSFAAVAAAISFVVKL